MPGDTVFLSSSIRFVIETLIQGKHSCVGPVAGSGNVEPFEEPQALDYMALMSDLC